MWPGVLGRATSPVCTGVTGKSDREPDRPLHRAVPAGACHPKPRPLGGQLCPCAPRFAGFLVLKSCWGGWEPPFLGGLWGARAGVGRGCVRRGSGATEPWPLPPGEPLPSRSKNSGHRPRGRVHVFSLPLGSGLGGCASLRGPPTPHPPRQAPGRPCSPPGKEHRQRVKTSPKSKPLDFQNGFIVLGVRVCFFPQVLPVTERKRKIPSPSSIWFSDSKSKVWCGGGIPGGCEGPQRPLCVRSGARSRSRLGPGPQHG